MLLLDANVLIDLAGGNCVILHLVATRLGPVHVLRDVLSEVACVNEKDCNHLGIAVVEPTVEQLLEAGTGRGRLSFADRLCLAVARDLGFVCVTNDKALRSSCEAAHVHVRWGLELLLDLVDAGVLEPDAAIEAARRIASLNPRLGATVLTAFEAKARKRER